MSPPTLLPAHRVPSTSSSTSASPPPVRRAAAFPLSSSSLPLRRRRAPPRLVLAPGLSSHAPLAAPLATAGAPPPDYGLLPPPPLSIDAGEDAALALTATAYADGPIQILPRLYLSGEQSANDPAVLARCGITTILTVASECQFPPRLTPPPAAAPASQHLGVPSAGGTGAVASPSLLAPVALPRSPHTPLRSATSAPNLRVSRAPPGASTSTGATPPLPANTRTATLPPDPASCRPWSVACVLLPWTHDQPDLAAPHGGFSAACGVIAAGLGLSVDRQGVLTGPASSETAVVPVSPQRARTPSPPQPTSPRPSGAAKAPRKPAVLVHCQCGISRSATAVIAYVMQSAALGHHPALLASLRGMHDAYAQVKDASPAISPNCALLYQLVEWERHLAALTALGPAAPHVPSPGPETGADTAHTREHGHLDGHGYECKHVHDYDNENERHEHEHEHDVLTPSANGTSPSSLYPSPGPSSPPAPPALLECPPTALALVAAATPPAPCTCLLSDRDPTPDFDADRSTEHSVLTATAESSLLHPHFSPSPNSPCPPRSPRSVLSRPLGPRPRRQPQLQPVTDTPCTMHLSPVTGHGCPRVLPPLSPCDGDGESDGNSKLHPHPHSRSYSTFCPLPSPRFILSPSLGLDPGVGRHALMARGVPPAGVATGPNHEHGRDAHGLTPRANTSVTVSKTFGTTTSSPSLRRQLHRRTFSAELSIPPIMPLPLPLPLPHAATATAGQPSAGCDSSVPMSVPMTMPELATARSGSDSGSGSGSGSKSSWAPPRLGLVSPLMSVGSLDLGSGPVAADTPSASTSASSTAHSRRHGGATHTPS